MRVERPSRRSVLKGAAVLLGATAVPSARAQNQNTVRLIYPFAAGSGGDTMARIVAEKLPLTVSAQQIKVFGGKLWVFVDVALRPNAPVVEVKS